MHRAQISQHLRSKILVALFSTMAMIWTGCKTKDTTSEDVHHLASTHGANGSFAIRQVDAIKPVTGLSGISTEHDIRNVTQDSACGLSQAQIRQIQAELGVYYVAPQDNLFWSDPKKPWVAPRNCGRLVEVTFGGACYGNHDWNCMKKGKFFPIPAGVERTVTLFIADWCGNSCARSDDNLKRIHLDIAAQVYQPGGPLFAMRESLRKVEQDSKKNGKTIQEANLFVEKIILTDKCVVAADPKKEIYASWATTLCQMQK